MASQQSMPTDNFPDETQELEEFESELERRISRREFLLRSGKGLAGLAVLGGAVTAGLLAHFKYCTGEEETTESNQETSQESEEAPRTPEERLRNTILSYLSMPAFSGPEFSREVTRTDAQLEGWYVDTHWLYFSILNNQEQATREQTIANISTDPNAVEFGLRERNHITFSDGTRFELGRIEQDVFRLPEQNFRVDLERVLEFNFGGGITYSINMPEMTNFLDNASIYGGDRRFQVGGSERELIVTANHGIYVARPEEPSLTRIVEQITRYSSTREHQAQRLLNFVTRDIRYNDSEALASFETMKRPNEVLWTGESDCSGKAILYASLLEQAGIDYRLVYLPEHIAVGVEGDFTDLNELSFASDGKIFHIAEPTAPEFIIGLSWPADYGREDIQFIQRPGENSQIINFRTGEAAGFR